LSPVYVHSSFIFVISFILKNVQSETSEIISYVIREYNKETQADRIKFEICTEDAAKSQNLRSGQTTEKISSSCHKLLK
jgi:hypothetical protein